MPSFGPTRGRNALVGNNFTGITTINFKDAIDPPLRPQVCRAIHFPRNPDFVQRSALSEYLATLLPPQTEYQSAALWGLGGSGKTQLALQYAHDRTQDPSCSVFWVHADTETSFTQDYKWIATKLGIAEGLDSEKILTAVRAHIESLPQWVLVLDNADDLALFGVGRAQSSKRDGITDLSAYIPRGTIGTVLWTSRDQRITGSLVGAGRGMNVSRMTDAEAEGLFRTLAILQVQGENEYGYLVQLLIELGWLPLAIAQAAAYIRRTRTPISVYLQMLQQKRKKRWKVLRRSEHDPHRRPEVTNSVLETWNISMEYIQREDKMAYDILTVLAYVDSQNIPFGMMVRIVEAQNRAKADGGGKETDDNNSQAGASEVGSSDSETDNNEDEVREAVARLEEFSFLTLRASVDSGNDPFYRTYDMHKLVQEAISYNLHRQKASYQVEREAAKVAFTVVNKLFPEQWSKESWADCEQYLGHAQGMCEWAAVHGGEGSVAMLLSKVSSYLYSRGRWREREIVNTATLKLLQKAFGDKHPDTIESMADLATSYHAQGKYNEDDRISVEVLGLRREILGDEHPDTIASMADLATTYNTQGKYDQAEKMRVEVLELRREILGDEHPDTIMSIENLATTYNTQGKYDQAEKMRVKVLELRRKILGDKHPNTITSMAYLATTYNKQGKYDQAENMRVEVLGLRREILGDKHPDTISSIADLATTYYTQGKYDQVEKMIVEVLELRREILGDEHPDTIASMADLATTYNTQGKYDQAEKIRVEVLELRRKILGDKHPNTITSMADLATTYHTQGKYDKVEKISVEVLGLRREILGDEHPDTITSMAHLATMYFNQGRYVDAESIEVGVLTFRQDILGLRHPDTILAMENLAATYFALQMFQEAENIYMEVVQIRREVLGEDHLSTLKSIENLESTQHALQEMVEIENHDLPLAALSLE